MTAARCSFRGNIAERIKTADESSTSCGVISKIAFARCTRVEYVVLDVHGLCGSKGVWAGPGVISKLTHALPRSLAGIDKVWSLSVRAVDGVVIHNAEHVVREYD